jgi:hypothetical protein
VILENHIAEAAQIKKGTLSTLKPKKPVGPDMIQ